MKKLLCIGLFLNAAVLSGWLWEHAPAEGEGGGAGNNPVGNGDVNGDGGIDISDASSLLNFLFLGGPAPLPCPLSGAGRRLPDTGQTQCFDCSGQPTECFDCTGQPRTCEGFQGNFLTLQDAFQRTGCPNDASRFTLNGDDTVTDNCTGLQWERFTDRDEDGLAEPFTWCGALDFCLNLSFAGHDDWRLPNVRELESIMDYGRSNPAADPVFRFTTDQFTQYWTSTTTLGDPRLAYFINFTIADVTRAEKCAGLSVRAVRGGF